MNPTPSVTRQRVALFSILLGIPLLATMFWAFVLHNLRDYGDLTFAIHEKGAGAQVRVSMPGVVVPIALSVAKHATGCPEVVRLGEFTSRNDFPVEIIREVVTSLEDCPDGVLVDIQTGTEVVLIEKRAGRVLVSIDTPDENVNASIPLGAARSFLGVI